MPHTRERDESSQVVLKSISLNIKPRHIDLRGGLLRHESHSEQLAPKGRWYSCSPGGAPNSWWSIAAAELVGTAMLVLLTCLSACSAATESLLHRGLVAGLVVAVVVQCFDHISGAMVNPTVTMAAIVMEHVTPSRGAVMMASQLVGALTGGVMLRFLEPPGTPDNICVTMPRDDLPIYMAVCIEVVISGALALANCASWDARGRSRCDSWPLRIGLTVAALSLTAGELTGASMNPVRSLAPALLSGIWDKHWIYWVSPLSGGVTCAGLYRRVWGPCRPPPRAGGLGVSGGSTVSVGPDAVPRVLSLPNNSSLYSSI